MANYEIPSGAKTIINDFEQAMKSVSFHDLENGKVGWVKNCLNVGNKLSNVASDKFTRNSSGTISDAINKLLAANYQNTYIIDGRYYKDKTMIEYINDNNIDDVLILSNAMLFWDDIEW